ncbi:MAG: MarR family transcriptional regulator [Kouleothrix sp.]|nr:MarR family transcriptional regulator [Kouleothrix sp.]
MLQRLPSEDVFQEQITAFIRAFGLHRPEQTPCGEAIAVAEAHALLELSRAAPLSQRSLAQRLRLEKSTISRLVGLLEQRGWITRARNAHDARVLELRLTVAGQQAAAQLVEARRVKFARLLDAIPAEHHPLVLEALRLLTEASNEQQ